MNNPFGDDLAGEQFATVFANLNPVIQGALGGFRELAEMFGSGPQATAQAVTTNLERAQGDGEVAVVSLLTGMDAIFKGYRASFASVESSLNAQIGAISAAWDRYGHTGAWVQPARRKISGSDAPEVLIVVSDPRLISDGERITPDATVSAIGKALTVSTNLASTSHQMFGTLVANVLPVGELMDAVDIAAVDHAKAFADLHKSLAANVQQVIDVIVSSIDAYQQTGRWNAPTVTICT
ncbi:hypothetical protein [Mycobacteroides abscessus]